MHNSDDTKTEGRRVFVYRGTIPPALALLLVAPLLFAFLSLAALLMAAGTVGALFLPFLLRRGFGAPHKANEIELDRDHYRQVDPDAPRLPRR